MSVAPMLNQDRPGRGPGGHGRSHYGIDTSPRVDLVNPGTGRASGGLAVTITGRKFAGNAAPVVTFNGIPASSVVVVNSTTITCVTPAQTEGLAADVVVQVGSQSSTLYGGFVYVIATVLGVDPSHGPITGGTVVMITGYNFQLGSTVFFDGSPATNVIFIDAQHIRATTPNHSNGFVNVTVVGP